MAAGARLDRMTAPAILRVALPEVETASDEVGLPIERDNLLLPCGESGRWTPKR